MPAALVAANPIEVTLAVFNRLYPDIDVKIHFKLPDDMPTPDLDDLDPADYGLEEFSEDDVISAAGIAVFDMTGKNPPEIWISLGVELLQIPNTLLEELAHIVCGYEEQHGPRFKQVYDHLCVEVQAVMDKPTPNNTEVAELARLYVNRREAGLAPLASDYEALKQVVQAERKGADHDA